MFEFVLSQTRSQKFGQQQRVEIVIQQRKVGIVGQIALQVGCQNVHIIVGIMPQERCSLRIIHKHLQCLFPCNKRLMSACFNHRIDHIAQHFGDGSMGFYINTKLRTGHHFSLFDLYCCNLHNVIVQYVKPRCLGVEDGYHLVFIGMDKPLHIGCVVVAQQIGQ